MVYFRNILFFIFKSDKFIVKFQFYTRPILILMKTCPGVLLGSKVDGDNFSSLGSTVSEI